MNFSEKLLQLRTKNRVSQEQLAEKLSVSRQSVSKWEVGQALPQIDKVLQICKIFSVSSDELLCDDIEIGSLKNSFDFDSFNGENKYFGTDGFRGEANITLTSVQAYKVGRFLGWYLSLKHPDNYRPKIVVGKDTRRSSYNIEYSLVAGITASGADAYMLHVTTTPSVSYVTRLENFDCGVMITASHNPYYDNGIKIINKYGEKIDDNTALLIEAYIDGNMSVLGIEDDIPFATRDKIGCIVDYVAGRNRYVGYLISLASHSYKHLKIGLDCANGASWMIAKAVFDALGSKTYVIGASPDGLNINRNCGSTHIENLCKLVKDQHLDIGIAFDGDADRCIAVDENGNIVDGDGILYVLSNRLKSRGMLEKDTVVATVMTNSGLEKALGMNGIKIIRTDVGDRFIYECMQENGFSIGGEQSGHIILKKYATTGDGILTAIMLIEQMCDEKLSLGQLVRKFKKTSQYEVSIRVNDKNAVINDLDIIEKMNDIQNTIGQNGRILLRKSGTEPVVRIMVEHDSIDMCKKYIAELSKMIDKKGYKID